MIQVVETREVGRPVDDVFGYVADFSTTAEYDPGVASAIRLDPVSVGAAFEVYATFLGRTIPMAYRLIELDAPHRLVFEGKSSSSRARDVISFTPSGAGTRIVWTLELQLLGLSAWLERPLRAAVRRSGRAALDGLAKRLTDPAPLTFGARRARPLDSRTASVVQGGA
jgi:carbon monoxide dehydrogenase subunit G